VEEITGASRAAYGHRGHGAIVLHGTDVAPIQPGAPVTDSQKVCLVLSGGVALGAYQAGAYAALHEREALWPKRIAASSVGAVNAALIAGGPPEERVARLRAFWEGMAMELGPTGPAWLGMEGPWRHAWSWMSVVQTRMFGRPGVFRPRVADVMLANADGLYDLGPLRARLVQCVDFARLNDGRVRLSIVATDVETGERVVFDTHSGDRIGPDHLIASCSLLPDFGPVQIDGRWLGDGGLVANAPAENALAGETGHRDIVCFVIDLFCAEGARPATLEEAAARRWDLIFANQTEEALRGLEREHRLRRALARHEGGRGTVKLIHLSHRAPPHEAGPAKPFDFSRASLAERWQAGYLDMEEAVRLTSSAAPRARGERGVRLSVWS
jgi:NTE family protein